MKKMILPVIIALVTGCSHQHTHDQEAETQEPEPLVYTLYTDSTELFVEFPPPVVGVETRFASHFTVLGERFTPLHEADITLMLTVNGKSVSTESSKPEVPGIFRLALTPNTAGTGTLVFRIKTKHYEDTITIDSVRVYADGPSALAGSPRAEFGGDISYLKEQAWKVEFANAPVRRQTFSDIIKTSGQILPAPGDEVVVSANASGIVLFSGHGTIIGSGVNAGAALFTITGGDMAEGNVDAAFREAKTNFEKARSDYERAMELVKDKIVSEKEFQETKRNFETAQVAYGILAKNYSANGLTVVAPIGGYVKSLFVTEGQYVTAGTPLASVSKNRKLILQANVSQKYFNKLSAIRSATFRTSGSDRFLSTTDLNGKIISYGKSASANSPFIPVSFEIDNTEAMITGSVAEVYLKSDPIPNVIVVPVSALIEEQGSFYAYVQTGGEQFQKRELHLGASDGIHVEVTSGLKEGERVVTKGAYQVKLAQVGGALPAHGHEH